MENLICNTDEKINTANFIRIGDLLYFEGPLLSLFKEENSGHFYVFDWVDRDAVCNRWLIYSVSATHLLHFINGKISHLELLENRPNKAIYVSEIDARNNHFSSYTNAKIANLPDSYLPDSDSFFELCDCISFEKIKASIIASLSRQKIENQYVPIYDIRTLKSNLIKVSSENKIDSLDIAKYLKHSEVPGFRTEIIPNLISNSVKYTPSSNQKKALVKKGYYGNQCN